MDDLAKKLAPIRERIIQRAEASLDELLTLLQGVAQPVDGEPPRERAIRIVHNLAGVGPTVGLNEVGAAARALEHELKASPDVADTSWQAGHARLGDALRAAKEAA